MKVNPEVELVSVKSSSIFILCCELGWCVDVVNVLDFGLLGIIKSLDFIEYAVSDPVFF